MSGIIWLASYPKSGNTWLRAFLANYLTNAQQPLPINDFPRFSEGDNSIANYVLYSGLREEELDRQTVDRLRPEVHRWLAASRTDHLFVKTHNAFRDSEDKPLITQEVTAAAIYVVRNPFDVAISYSHHFQVTLDRAIDALNDPGKTILAGGRFVEQHLGSWSGHVLGWTRAPGLIRHVMRYEDMKSAPRQAFAGLTRFLGLPADDERLQRAMRFSDFEELRGQERDVRFVESRFDGKSKFFREGRSGQWREVLSQQQIQRLIDAHRPALQHTGYLAHDGAILAA
jgi:hypothetical protein